MSDAYDEHYRRGGFGYEASREHWERWVSKNYVSDFELASGMCLLDVGCGDGFWASLLAEHGLQVTGIDTSTGAIETARARYSTPRFVQADAGRELPFAPGEFDVIFMRTFSPFLRPDLGDVQLRTTLTAVLRHLTPGGMLLVSCYSKRDGTVEGSATNHPASAYVNTLERVAEPYKMTVVDNYVTVGARVR
jgi:SAM-dependent methyltransferase